MLSDLLSISITFYFSFMKLVLLIMQQLSLYWCLVAELPCPSVTEMDEEVTNLEKEMEILTSQNCILKHRSMSDIHTSELS